MHRIIDVLSLSTGYLRDHGVPRARLNAELLLCNVLGKSRIELYLEYNRPLVEEELSSLRKLLRERGSHKPLQYVLGTTEFFSLPFSITEGVFIPRPETEILVQQIIDHVNSLYGKGEFILFDVGTGCGCIAVSIAHTVENCRVYASDISGEAVAVARRNAERNGVAERVTVLQGDLFGPFAEHGTPKADVIASNSPYIAVEEWDSLPDEVRCFEPRESLLAGEEGLDFLRRITQSAEAFLKPGGSVFLEIGHGQRDAVVALLEARQKYMDIQSRQDYNGIQRVLSARLVDPSREVPASSFAP